MSTAQGAPADSRPGSVADAVANVLTVGLALAVVGAIVLLSVDPGDAWIVDYHAVPDLMMVACLVLGVSVVATCGTWARRVRCNLLLAGTMASVYLLSVAPPLGDFTRWMQASTRDTAGVSALLANAVYHVAFAAGGRNAVFLVAPVFGFVTAFLVLALCDKLFLDASSPQRNLVKKICCLAFLAGSWHLLFFTRSVETAPTSLPGLLLALWFLSAYCGRGAAAPARPRTAFCLGAIALGGAALFHGPCLGLLPALPCAAWFGASPDRAPAARWGDLASGALAFAATGAVAVFGLLWLGMNIDTGHLTVAAAGGSSAPSAPLAAGHLRFAANAACLASPLLLAAPFVVATRAGRQSLGARPILMIFAWGSWACLALTFLVRSDLGFPGDYASLSSLGLLSHLFLLNGVLGLAKSSRVGAAIACVCVSVGGFSAWAVVASLAVPNGPEPAAHPKGPRFEGGVLLSAGHVVPTLFVNGRVGIVQLRRGERITLEMRKPPGCREPAPFILAAHLGSPSDAAGDEGPVIPVRGPWNERTILLANSLPPPPIAAGTPSTRAPWSLRYHGAAPRHATLQGLILDASGVVRATNAVIVRSPR